MAITTNRLTQIPTLDSYSQTEIDGFLKFSSISSLYFNLMKNPDIDSIYKFRHQAWLETALSNFHNKLNQQDRSRHWSNSMDRIVKQVFDLYFNIDDKIIVLALGKFGSQVLNLSSDIDIILISDQSVNPELLKKARSFLQHLNAKTEFGFLTRVDLNLKPSSQPGPVINSEQLTNYLWQSSEMWERLVYTRARIICGKLDDQSLLTEEIRKFCYRKYIRLDLVENLSELIIKILKNNFDPQNIKLCPGGIRSVELLLSAIQLLYGGRLTEIQAANTYDIINKLNLIQVFSPEQIIKLRDNYNTLRTEEDRIQMQMDEQKHTTQNLDQVETLLIENYNIIEIFLKKIFKKKDVESSVILSKLNEMSKKHPHLLDFVKFLNKHPSYISLFETHPKSYENLLKALTYSPQVSKLILLRPDLLDMFLIKKESISENDNDEDFLISLSDFKSISQITAIGEFLTHFDHIKLLAKSSKTADLCVAHILKRVFGNRSLDILKLGKWASSELGVISDLDFVFINSGVDDLSKLSRKFINYLTHGTFHGPFYNIDLRLRPSGHAGPIVSSQEKLKLYLETSASIWQRQAYLRNQLLIGQKSIDYQISKLSVDEKIEIMDIRQKRFLKTDSDQIHLKEGFGGLVDLEFLVQCLFLNISLKPMGLTFSEMVKELVLMSVLNEQQSSQLINQYNLLRTFEQLSKIIFKTNIVTIDSFQKLIAIPNFMESLKIQISSFEDLITLFKSNCSLIDLLHPFKVD